MPNPQATGTGKRHRKRQAGLKRVAIRLAMNAAQRVRMGFWRITRPRAFGVHALVYDKAGRLFLVRHSYAKGWRLPGGGVKRGETAEQAVLRELREEIGLRRYGAMREALVLEHRPEYRRGLSTFFVVEDAAIDFSPSLEIEEVSAFHSGELPEGTTELTRRVIEAVECDETYLVWQRWRDRNTRPSPTRDS